jgi:predicted Zn-dependent peptidase
MPNRTQPPLIRQIENLRLPPIEKIELDNGIPVHVVNMGTQEVLKLEVVFYAGRPFERKQLAARATAAMLKEGSKSYDSEAIAEQFDYFGSSFRTPFNIDTCDVVLYTLNKYFDNVLPIVAEVLAAPSFPQNELDNFIQINRRNLQLDLTKNDNIAYRTVTEMIFGTEHPYGYNSFPETYLALQRDDLLEHYHRCFNSQNCDIIISGKVTDQVLESLNRHLGQAVHQGKVQQPRLALAPAPERSEHINNPKTVQTAIRLGRRLFNRQHEDYPGVYLLNTVLGGYFGSRLMANIREDKGYTYNVYSVLDSMSYDGSFFISTEVGNEFAGQTLREIYREMEALRREPVSAEEFEMVQNYVMGTFLTMLDGPFNVAEVVKTMVLEHLPVEHFEEFVRRVQAITPRELMRLAQHYLDPNDWYEVVVGDQGTIKL